MAVSTYATFFGVVFTALVFIYFIATGQTSEFRIPLQVRRLMSEILSLL